jgi:hypothetical protein
MNHSHRKKSVNSGYMSNRRKSLIIIMTLLLLKIMSNKTSLIELKRTIRVSLNFIDSLTSDRTNTWGQGTRSHVPVRSRATIYSAIACCHSG